MDNVTIPVDFQVGKPTDEDIKRVEDTFLGLCKNHNIKYKSKKYYEFQFLYFSGAMMMCDYSLPSWSIAIMSQREIVDKY